MKPLIVVGAVVAVVTIVLAALHLAGSTVIMVLGIVAAGLIIGGLMRPHTRPGDKRVRLRGVEFTW